MMKLRKSESSLVELKAKVDSLDGFRKRLKAMEARSVGTFHQIDTYFEVPEGRLKLRETEGRKKAEIIYYEREDIPEPKRCRAFIIELEDPDFFKTFLQTVLKEKVIVDKTREIYRHQGTQIHLDTVKNLGTFIEFERKTEGTPEATSKDRDTLEDLMKTLGINTKDLIEDSYSDLLTQGRK
jgi:adenylate cyclase class 2